MLHVGFPSMVVVTESPHLEIKKAFFSLHRLGNISPKQKDESEEQRRYAGRVCHHFWAQIAVNFYLCPYEYLHLLLYIYI